MKRLLALALCLFALPALAAIDGTQILQKVDRNLEPEAYESYRQLVDIQPDGSKKEYVLYTIKKGRDKVVALFLAPPSEKGRVTLRLAENMWLYMPDVGRPIRITSLQSVTGSIFNNADILRIDYSAEYAVVAAEEQKDALLLTLKAKTAEVAYDRLKMWVDKTLLLPTTIEAYAASGLLIKTLHFSNIKDFGGGIKRPATVTTDSPLQKGYKSVMQWSGIKRADYPDETFTLNALPRIQELRK
ncbi:outer membrane lipoprotein-sorting protein [Piscinibacter sp.]|uniref:outer membrane lipoprotein-sorting protein n=1 Tax=Piscinibacter sp. TaxID=1903157 RepID=UPI003559501B